MAIGSRSICTKCGEEFHPSEYAEHWKKHKAEKEWNFSDARIILRGVLIDTLKDILKVDAIMKEIERVDKEFIRRCEGEKEVVAVNEDDELIYAVRLEKIKKLAGADLL